MTKARHFLNGRFTALGLYGNPCVMSAGIKRFFAPAISR
jgi:hypothetical protein